MGKVRGSLAAVAAVCILTGCGTGVPDTGQYVEAEGLERVLDSTVLELMTPDAAGGEEWMAPSEAYAGDGTETEAKVLKAADIFSQPGENASRIGSVEEGEAVTLIGNVEEGDWRRVCYNGRVAYIMADAVAAVNEGLATPESEATGLAATPEPTPVSGQVSNKPKANTSPATPAPVKTEPPVRKPPETEEKPEEGNSLAGEDNADEEDGAEDNSETVPEPPESTEEPPEVTLEPPEFTEEPPEMTLEPPESTEEPPEVTLEPPETKEKPPEMTLEPPKPPAELPNNTPEPVEASSDRASEPPEE